MAATGVPVMLKLGIPETLTASTTAVSGSIAVFAVILIAFFSGLKNNELFSEN